MTRLILPQGSHVLRGCKEEEAGEMDCEVYEARVLVLRNGVLCVR
jgi:hypothetical protein